MYSFALFLHNALRWATLFFGAYSLLRAATGIVAKGTWLKADDAARRFFPVTLDVQFVLGFSLWAFLSPLTSHIVRSGSFGSVHDPQLRFYAIDHAAAGLLALILAHVGSARARRLRNARAKFQSILVFHGLALVVVLARIPWDRPFFHAP
jgi:hypothetical protein